MIRLAILWRLPFCLAMVSLVNAQTGGGPDEVPEFEPIPQALELPPPDRGVPMTFVQFRGVTAFPEDRLRDEIAEQLGGIRESGLTPARADDTAFFLAIYYRKHGYSQVEVEEEIAPSGELLLNVSEGPVTNISEIRFIGNEFIETETLREYLLGATVERLGKSDPVPFVEGDIQTGVARIRGLYLSEGFLKSDVADPEIVISHGGAAATVTVRIDEGLRYLIGPVVVSGDLVFFPQDDLKEQLASYAGKPYTPTQVSNMRRSVVYYYKTRGYFDTAVETTVAPQESEDGNVPVAFHVNSGDIYTFDGIEVSGLDRLKESFLQKRFGQLAGEIYSPEKLDEVFREMMQTGLFNQFNVRSEPLDNQQIRLHITLEEAKAREVGFALGYGTFEGPFAGVSAAERNLFGTGRVLRANVEVSQRFLKGEVLFRDRWLFDTRNEFDARLYGLSTEYEGYSKFELGARAGLSREVIKNLKVTMFLRARDVATTSLGIEEVFMGPTDYMVNSAGISMELDHRNSLLNPRKGWILAGTGEYATSALGSDLEYMRATYRVSYYLPIGRFLLAAGARGGIVGGGGTLPIDERFFNGGSRSVRSFAERELGPKSESGFPIGGRAYSVYNLEFVFPIAGELEGAVFADAGSVSDSPVDSAENLRYGVGVGLRYNLPIGPVRLDYGRNPSPAAGEASGAIHFSFGFAF